MVSATDKDIKNPNFSLCITEITQSLASLLVSIIASTSRICFPVRLSVCLVAYVCHTPSSNKWIFLIFHMSRTCPKEEVIYFC